MEKPAMDNKRPIWLIGFMGSGKSTVGKLLAEKFGRKFTDTDSWIEEKSGKSVAVIFEQEGEEKFRQWEKRFAEERQPEPEIIACGGGFPCFNGLLERMLETGTVVYLSASPETLAKHLHHEREQRPLLKDQTDESLLQYIRERLEKRVSFYLRAHKIVSVDSKSPAEIVAEIATGN